MEVEAISIGLNYEYYWSLTPKLYETYRKAFVEKTKREMKQQDLLNHMLGRYIAYGVNDPKKYPQQPYLDDSMPAAMTDEQMEERARRNTIRMGGSIK